MDKRLGNKSTPAKVCAVTNKVLSHGQAGRKIKLHKDYFCFIRSAVGGLSKVQTDELKALARTAFDARAKASAPVATKKESIK